MIVASLPSAERPARSNRKVLEAASPCSVCIGLSTSAPTAIGPAVTMQNTPVMMTKEQVVRRIALKASMASAMDRRGLKPDEAGTAEQDADRGHARGDLAD